MIRFGKQLKPASLSQEHLNAIISEAVTSCYGVAGIANPNAQQRLRILPLRRDMRVHGHGLVVNLRILTMSGLNISAIARGVTAKVRCTVEESTGLHVNTVNVFVDGMISRE